MTQAPGSRRRRRRKGRDERGRFQAGFSGNPNGRPKKQPEVPKLLGEQLADKLWEKVARVGADGKTRTMSAYELIVERFIEYIPNAKPSEIMAILKWMEHLDVFSNMRAKVEDPHVNMYEDQHNEWWRSQIVLKAIRDRHRQEADARVMADPRVMAAIKQCRERSGSAD
jgi:hypothetical protein